MVSIGKSDIIAERGPIMSNNRILSPLVILLILFFCIGCGNTTEKSSSTKNISSDKMNLIKKKNEVTNIYINNRFKFSVEYPKKWNTKEDIFYEATAEHNSSPDDGITIYVDNDPNNVIYVFGQFGHINVGGDPGFIREDYVTNSGLKGNLFRGQIDGKEEEYLILNDGFLGAHVSVTSECFNRNEEVIVAILKSIKSFE